MRFWARRENWQPANTGRRDIGKNSFPEETEEEFLADVCGEIQKAASALKQS